MLTKLIKYEIKATRRIFLLFFLSLLVFAAITKLIHSLNPQDYGFSAYISMAVYVTIMVGLFVTTLLVLVQRFYRNLLSDEGYLMFTLPVSSWKHIVCKLLVSMLWIAASIAVALISIFIIVYEKGAIIEISRGFAELFGLLDEQLGLSLYYLSFEAVIFILTSLTSGILVVYASMAVGHLSSKHKLLASFGAFIVFNTLAQILFVLFSLAPETFLFPNIHISFYDIAGFKTAMQLFFAYGILYTGLLSAAYFAVTEFILSKKLNLE